MTPTRLNLYSSIIFMLTKRSVSMKNFIFISPNFPTNYWKFCAELKKNGMNVLGIGDCPIASLARHAARGGKLGALKPLDSNDVLAILELAKSSN